MSAYVRMAFWVSDATVVKQEAPRRQIWKPGGTRRRWLRARQPVFQPWSCGCELGPVM